MLNVIVVVIMMCISSCYGELYGGYNNGTGSRAIIWRLNEKDGTGIYPVYRPPSNVVVTFRMSLDVKRDMVWMYQRGENWVLLGVLIVLVMDDRMLIW